MTDRSQRKFIFTMFLGTKWSLNPAMDFILTNHSDRNKTGKSGQEISGSESKENTHFFII